MCSGVFRACSQFYRHLKIRVANFEMHTTRIFAVKIRVANFEMLTTRIFAVKFELHILKCTQLSAMKIGVANVNCKKIYIDILYEPRYCSVEFRTQKSAMLVNVM